MTFKNAAFITVLKIYLHLPMAVKLRLMSQAMRAVMSMTAQGRFD